MSTKYVDHELLEAEEELRAIYDGTLGIAFIDDDEEFCLEEERPWFDEDDPFDEQTTMSGIEDDDDDDCEDENWLGFDEDSEQGW